MTYNYAKNFPGLKVFFVLLILSYGSLHAQTQISDSNLIYSDNFIDKSDNWIPEYEKPLNSSFTISDGKLELKTSAGATIWFNHKLSGNIAITYNVVIQDSGKSYDRVSDLNAFWMASDPANKNLFTRDGDFFSYDNLALYYAGVGGHDNTITRFRKYGSDGKKPILKEYTDKEHLLVGNKVYSIRIICDSGLTSFYINDSLFFEYRDSSPLSEGYFAFRTTTSHQLFRNFRIYKLN